MGVYMSSNVFSTKIFNINIPSYASKVSSPLFKCKVIEIVTSSALGTLIGSTFGPIGAIGGFIAGTISGSLGTEPTAFGAFLLETLTAPKNYNINHEADLFGITALGAIAGISPYAILSGCTGYIVGNEIDKMLYYSTNYKVHYTAVGLTLGALGDHNQDILKGYYNSFYSYLYPEQE
jgi:hypothetical protein